MEFRHLTYFIAVADEGSFSRAANRLRVSQPTLSQQVRALEREIGGALFVRTPRSIELTPAGEELLARGRDVLHAADGALLAARDRARTPAAGVLHVGVAPAVAKHLLADTVPLFRTLFPNTRLVPKYLTAGFESELVDGDIDVGIMMLPLDPDRVHFEVLGHVERLLFVPKHHELADACRIRLEDALPLTYVPADRTFGRTFTEFWQLDSERGGPPRCSSGEPARLIHEVGQRVVFGEGVAVGIGGLEAEADGAVALPVDGLTPAIAVVARRRTDTRSTTRTFCDLAISIYRNIIGKAEGPDRHQ